MRCTHASTAGASGTCTGVTCCATRCVSTSLHTHTRRSLLLRPTAHTSQHPTSCCPAALVSHAIQHWGGILILVPAVVITGVYSFPRAPPVCGGHAQIVCVTRHTVACLVLLQRCRTGPFKRGPSSARPCCMTPPSGVYRKPVLSLTHDAINHLMVLSMLKHAHQVASGSWPCVAQHACSVLSISCPPPAYSLRLSLTQHTFLRLRPLSRLAATPPIPSRPSPTAWLCCTAGCA